MQRSGGGAGCLAHAPLAGKHGDTTHGTIEQQLPPGMQAVFCGDVAATVFLLACMMLLLVGCST